MKKLLILIDLQKGWLHSSTKPAMLKAVELSRQFDADTVHCCFRNDPASLFHKQINWKRFVDPADTEQIEEIKSLNLPVYWRSTYSCLNEEMAELIKNYDVVYVAGVFTDVSVYVTAMAIFDANTPVCVVRDCVATLHGEQAHKSALKSLDFTLGSHAIVDSSQIIGS
jgi:nicotinamidase-related amidase